MLANLYFRQVRRPRDKLYSIPGRKPLAGKTIESPSLLAPYARIGFTTWAGSTPVRRKSSPWNL